MGERKEISLRKVFFRSKFYSSEKLTLVFNKSQNKVQIYLMNGVKNWLFVIQKRHMTKKKLKPNFTKRNLSIQFRQMCVFLRRAPADEKQEPWEFRGKVRDSFIEVYPEIRQRNQDQTDCQPQPICS